MLSLTGMLESATMASSYLFLLNELVKNRGIGELEHIIGELEPIMVATFLHWICSFLSTVNIGLDVDSTCMFGSYPHKNIIYWSLTRIKCLTENRLLF